jgi:PAS domain S-box-containing protein
MIASTTPYLEWLIALGGAVALLLTWFGWGRKAVERRRATIREQNARELKRAAMLEHVYVTLKPNSGSSLTDHVAEIRDVTSRTDKTLAITETGRRTLVAIMEIGEWHSNEQGACIYINPAACRLCNRPESDFLGRNWYNVVHPADAEWVAEQWDLAVRERRTFQARYRWTRSDGSPVPIRVVANPSLDSRGSLIGWVAIVRSDA